MFEQLKQLFLAGVEDTPSLDPEDETHLATAALLINLANADGAFSAVERATLSRLLHERFGLGDADVRSLVERAEREDKQAVDLFAFTHALKRRLDDKARLNVVEMLWEIACADGIVHEFEDNLVWRVADLLGVPSTSRIALKREMEARMPPAGIES